MKENDNKFSKKKYEKKRPVKEYIPFINIT